MQKYEMARLLAQRCGYTSNLEICTLTTGNYYAFVDKAQFTRRARLMYRRPPDFEDGEQFDYSSDSESGEALFGELMRSGERFDLVFIDPFHTYESSLRDIVFGLQLVKPNGTILIHDCSPPHPACAVPEFFYGEWCGVTYAAYLDVVLFAEGAQYATVDSDYGCGIISKHPGLSRLVGSCPDPNLTAKWRKLDLAQKYAFLDEHRSELLRLVSPEDFLLRLADEPKRRSKWAMPAVPWTWPIDIFEARARRWLQPAR